MRPTALALLTLLTLAPCAALPAQDVPLATGDSHAGSLEPHDAGHRYTLSVGAEHHVRGSVDQVSVDVALRILGPDEEVVAGFDGPPRGAEPFRFETEAAGDYVVEVTPFEDESGDYVITLDRNEPIAADPAGRADQLLSTYDNEHTPGAVVSVWKDGETVFARAYGMANLTYGIPYGVDTPTNIGSSSKQFTAFAVMLLVERGELSLDDDVRTHISELPDLGETVTVRHLLTHTTGYREFLNLLSMTGRRMDRGDSIDRRELIEIVRRQPALQNAPGSEWNYNNTAFGLAAVIVERLSGRDFPEFMRDEVFEPLGMTRSVVRASPLHMLPGRAVGYMPGAGGTWLEINDLAGAMGAGGIYTTVTDLQRWAQELGHPTLLSPGSVEQMTTAFVLTDGESSGYGLGLFVDEHRGLRRVHHGGADMAFRSHFILFPGIDAGLTVQSNHALFDGGIPARLVDAFFGEHMQPEAEDTDDESREAVAAVDPDFDPASYAVESFDDLAGRYALDKMPGFVLTFTREDGSLYTQGTGQPRIEIVPTSELTFELVGVEAALTFHRGEGGTVGTLTLHQGGDHPGTRLEETDEPADLRDYTGRFFSEELETFYTVTLRSELPLEENDEADEDAPPAQDALVLQQRRLDDMALTAGGADDTFHSATGFALTFERDRNGQVVAFYLSNGRTRDVRFARLGD